jgi:hypothetical protein
MTDLFYEDMDKKVSSGKILHVNMRKKGNRKGALGKY